MSDWKREDPEHALRAVAALEGLGLPGEVRLYEGGSVPVFWAGDAVVKLMPPEDSELIEREVEALRVLEGRLSIPTPRLLARVALEGWTALVMTRLPGISLRSAWPSLSQPQRVELVRALGRGLAELHAVPVEGLTALGMEGFVSAQRSTARSRQEARGLSEGWLAQIEPFLASVTWVPSEPVLLHTEVMREHLVVESGQLTGLFDFEPSMVGHPEYELASVGLFVTEGEPGLLRELLLAYGMPEASLTPELSRRLMGWALLHRYSDLRWYLSRLPGGDTLEELAGRWFGL